MRRGLTFFYLAFMLFCVAPLALGADKTRVIYVEGGEYQDYIDVFKGMTRGLYLAGLIKTDPKGESVPEIWRALVEDSRRPEARLEFLPDGLYSANWDDAVRDKNRAAVYKRMHEKKDVGLIISMGTWAGVDMTREEHTTPMMILSCSDPLGAGLMKDRLDSGRDNVFVTVDPGRWERQLVFFHSLFKFKKLGIAYEDTPDGRSQAGMDAIEQAAKILGFQLVPCTAQFDVPEVELAHTRLMACHKELARRVDAMYLTVNTALRPGSIGELVEPLTLAGVPTFAQLSPTGVQEGILLDIAQEDLTGHGLFAAQVLQRILDGETPRRIPNWLNDKISISMNMQTARRIGWKPEFLFMFAVDSLYQAKSEWDY